MQVQAIGAKKGHIGTERAAKDELVCRKLHTPTTARRTSTPRPYPRVAAGATFGPSGL